MTGVVAVVPVRSFRSGMSRLASVLSEDRRHALAVELAARVLDSARRAGAEPVVVTSDPETASWAAADEAAVLSDPGEGLDGACQAGATWAMERGARWVILHSDLPLLTPDDVRTVVRSIHEGMDVIAPSSDGGTSALSSRTPIGFAYGPASFHSHLARLSDPVVVVRRGLLHDLDTPDDLASAMRAGAIAG